MKRLKAFRLSLKGLKRDLKREGTLFEFKLIDRYDC